MNYTTYIRRDVIFDGFEPMTGAPNSHDEHDLDLPSDGVREITPAATPALNLEQIMPSEDGWMDPATEAAHSAAIEPNTDLCHRTLGLVFGHRLGTVCIRSYRI